MESVKKSNLLKFRGVFAKDISTDVNYGKNTTPVAVETKIFYANIPKRFTDVASWPKVSNLRCWNCDQLTKSYPKFVPVGLERVDGKIRCDVHGHFHEWNCAVSYVMKEFPENQRWDTLRAISIIESEFTGTRREIIPPAPSKFEMKVYCGDNGITSQQWCDRLAAVNSTHTLAQHRMEQFREIN